MSTRAGTRRRSPEVRAEVMSALLQGQGVAETAKEYEIPVSTVSDWKRAAWEEAGRETDIGVLLVDYLTESLTTLRAQVAVFRDPDWLKSQGASDAAVLHGVLTDKAVRLLEALEPGHGPELTFPPESSQNGKGRRF